MTLDALDAGDTSRQNGDYIGFPIPDTGYPAQGEVVTYDGTDLATVTGDNSDAVAGVVANLPVAGDDDTVQTDRDATVKTRGAVIADLSAYADGTATVSVGGTLGANDELYVVEEVDAANNLYEVLVR